MELQPQFRGVTSPVLEPVPAPSHHWLAQVATHIPLGSNPSSCCKASNEAAGRPEQSHVATRGSRNSWGSKPMICQHESDVTNKHGWRWWYWHTTSHSWSMVSERKYHGTNMNKPRKICWVHVFIVCENRCWSLFMLGDVWWCHVCHCFLVFKIFQDGIQPTKWGKTTINHPPNHHIWVL